VTKKLGSLKVKGNSKLERVDVLRDSMQAAHCTIEPAVHLHYRVHMASLAVGPSTALLAFLVIYALWM